MEKELSIELDAKQSVKSSIELWLWLTATGRLKSDWPEWDYNGGKYHEVDSNCFLCEYDELVIIKKKLRHLEACNNCPYYIKFGQCTDSKSPFYKWEVARTSVTRKKYAGLFLERLREVLKDLEKEGRNELG